uniref:Uncharacterized protein n=1 Tax=Anguilla anguilla TaxID=7936 RepID=A0A0E9W9T5_ANGAN
MTSANIFCNKPPGLLAWSTIMVLRNKVPCVNYSVNL